jgi:hypothetical protein
MLEAALDRPVQVLLGRGRRDGHPLEQAEQLLEWVVAGPPAVVDEVEADLAGPLVDL